MSGHESSFGRVYDTHVWRVYGFFAYRVRNHELAEDLTQATFERALRSWSRFDPNRASEATWLLVIARNLLIDYHRRERVVLQELLEEHVRETSPGPEERFATSPELVAALEQLGGRERDVLALRFGGDLAAAEIAAVLELSLANVQQILSRSLRRLRLLLEGTELARDHLSDPPADV
jgi:RNA polymerase sigma factor (sigma-70 family)